MTRFSLCLVQGCSGVGTAFPHLLHVLLWNELEAVSKWLFFWMVPTPFLWALHPWSRHVLLMTVCTVKGNILKAKVIFRNFLNTGEASQLADDFSKLCLFEFPSRALAKNVASGHHPDVGLSISQESVMAAVCVLMSSSTVAQWLSSLLVYFTLILQQRFKTNLCILHSTSVKTVEKQHKKLEL